ncbi:hypothetical protein AGMMS4952_04730 [Spirochaetia bacterium]|nr:hypothetical protein AGMMS4952_04730 [Spirochaetia bacterium]
MKAVYHRFVEMPRKKYTGKNIPLPLSQFQNKKINHERHEPHELNDLFGVVRVVRG